MSLYYWADLRTFNDVLPVFYWQVPEMFLFIGTLERNTNTLK